MKNNKNNTNEEIESTIINENNSRKINSIKTKINSKIYQNMNKEQCYIEIPVEFYTNNNNKNVDQLNNYLSKFL